MPSINLTSYSGTSGTVVTYYTGLGYNASSFPPTTVAYADLRGNSVTKRRVSVTTSNFMTLKKQGRLPVNPYSYTSHYSEQGSGTISSVTWLSTRDSVSGPDIYGRAYRTVVMKGNDRRVWNNLTRPSFPTTSDPADIANADAKAITSLLSQIKNQKINAAQFWAERRQTLDLVQNTASRIASSFSALRSGNIVSAGKVLTGVRPSRRIRRNFRKDASVDRAASQAWLEMQYGWIPLLNDVKGAVEALDTHLSSLQIVRAVGRGSASDSGVIKGSSNFRTTTTTKWKTEVFVKYCSFFRVEMDAVQTSTSLGLQNPAVLAWELLPYSFVVDWFLPIGNYLSSLDATAGTAFTTGSRTITQRYEATTTWEVSESLEWNPAYLAISRYSGKVTQNLKGVTISRTVSTGFPKPSYPVPKNPISSTHVLNALALLTTAFRR